MAGIYIHIPFCKVKCHYCDFHFSTQTGYVNEMVKAMISEIEHQKNYLNNEPIETIYFGGGTPSFIGSKNIGAILQSIFINFNVLASAEITLECNPDDLSKDILNDFKSLGINRLSIGIQSFNDDVLKYLNRAHNKQQIFDSLRFAQAIGFVNITVDLMYGLPHTDLNYWEEQLNHFKNLNVPHLSAYCFTIEPRTKFGHDYKKGDLHPISDENTLNQMNKLFDFCLENDFEQYEISNFAKAGYISKHNSAYWLDKKYLGIGPSAHSYNKISRRWNVSNNKVYMDNILSGKDYFELEMLTEKDKFNDYILTRLRTKWGINLNEMNLTSVISMREFKEKLDPLIEKDLIQKHQHIYILTKEGKFLADKICTELFV